jgi:hypothetical protein
LKRVIEAPTVGLQCVRTPARWELRGGLLHCVSADAPSSKRDPRFRLPADLARASRAEFDPCKPSPDLVQRLWVDPLRRLHAAVWDANRLHEYDPWLVRERFLRLSPSDPTAALAFLRDTGTFEAVAPDIPPELFVGWHQSLINLMLSRPQRNCWASLFGAEVRFDLRRKGERKPSAIVIVCRTTLSAMVATAWMDAYYHLRYKCCAWLNCKKHGLGRPPFRVTRERHKYCSAYCRRTAASLRHKRKHKPAKRKRGKR